MADDLIGKLGDLFKRKPCYELPYLLAAGRLVEIRNELRENNLHDTEEPAGTRQGSRRIWIPGRQKTHHK